MPFTSKTVATHAQNRSKVCILCFEKGSSMKDLNDKTIVDLKRVRDYFFTNYDHKDMKFPNGLCARCRKLLQRIDLPTDHKEKKDVSDLPDPVDFSKLKFPALTRSSGSLNLVAFFVLHFENQQTSHCF